MVRGHASVTPRTEGADDREARRVSSAADPGLRARNPPAGEDEALHVLLVHEPEPVPQSDLADARDLRDRFLRAPLALGQARQIDRGRSGPDRTKGRGRIRSLDLLDDPEGLGVHVLAEAELGAEAAHVVRGLRGRDAQPQLPQEGAVGLSDDLLSDARRLLEFVEGPRYAGDAARGIDRGSDEGLNRTAAQEASLEGLLADEPGFLTHRAGQSQEGGHSVHGTEGLREAALPGPRVTRVPLELPDPVELLPLLHRDHVPAGVAVRGWDHGRQAHPSCREAPRRAGPGKLVALFRT